MGLHIRGREVSLRSLPTRFPTPFNPLGPNKSECGHREASLENTEHSADGSGGDGDEFVVNYTCNDGEGAERLDGYEPR